MNVKYEDLGNQDEKVNLKEKENRNNFIPDIHTENMNYNKNLNQINQGNEYELSMISPKDASRKEDLNVLNGKFNLFNFLLIIF